MAAAKRKAEAEQQAEAAAAAKRAAVRAQVEAERKAAQEAVKAKNEAEVAAHRAKRQEKENQARAESEVLQRAPRGSHKANSPGGVEKFRRNEGLARERAASLPGRALPPPSPGSRRSPGRRGRELSLEMELDLAPPSTPLSRSPYAALPQPATPGSISLTPVSEPRSPGSPLSRQRYSFPHPFGDSSYRTHFVVVAVPSV